jgi:2-succinyl-5-enolpyruvyl-6-hydroxy-3-cyclohexene-1-carboxylate synthase
MSKINLLIDSPNVKDGYVNIDPFTQDGNQAKISGAVSKLDHTVDNGEASEIIAEDVIDYLGPDYVDKAINNWLSKLQHGGIIVIGGTDIRVVCKSYFLRQLNTVEVNNLLYGEQKNVQQYKKSCLTIHEVCELLKSLGLKIILKRHDGFRYLIKAKRP